MEAGITKHECEILASFRYTLRKYLRFSEEEAAVAGLTPQQHQAMLAIKGFPGRDVVTVAELAERLQVRHHSAVGLINRLVALGLAARHPCTDDRRQVHVQLSELGEARLAALASAHRIELRRMQPDLSALLRQIADSPGCDRGSDETTL